MGTADTRDKSRTPDYSGNGGFWVNMHKIWFLHPGVIDVVRPGKDTAFSQIRTDWDNACLYEILILPHPRYRTE